MSDPSLKAAIIVSKVDHRVIKTFERKVPKLMKQTILLTPFGCCTYPDNFAFKLIDNTMPRLREAGILQYHFNYLVNFELKPLLDPEWEPIVFSVSNLEFGFVTWLISCGIAVGIFTAQLLWCYAKREVQNFCVLFAILAFVASECVV